jgi:hypothetical protein
MSLLSTVTQSALKLIRILADRRITPDEYEDAAQIIEALAIQLTHLAHSLRTRI